MTKADSDANAQIKKDDRSGSRGWHSEKIATALRSRVPDMPEKMTKTWPSGPERSFFLAYLARGAARSNQSDMQEKMTKDWARGRAAGISEKVTKTWPSGPERSSFSDIPAARHQTISFFAVPAMRLHKDAASFLVYLIDDMVWSFFTVPPTRATIFSWYIFRVHNFVW